MLYAKIYVSTLHVNLTVLLNFWNFYRAEIALCVYSLTELAFNYHEVS